MKATLLVLLVGELTAPFRVELERALPAAFPRGAPEVAVGAQAPAGRTVAWVTLSNQARDVELVLHTARVPGELRRVLHFSAADGLHDRAASVAFTLAAMADEREAALDALTPVPAPSARWRLGAEGHGSLDLPGAAGGGGGSVFALRWVLDWLAAGLHFDLTASAAARSTHVLAPTLWAEALARPGSARVRPLAALGVGASLLVVGRASTTLSAWRPVFRAVLGIDVALAGPHHVWGGVAGHLTPGEVTLPGTGASAGSSVGPGWLRLELGYAGEF